LTDGPGQAAIGRDKALAQFDGLPPVEIGELAGLWRGAGLHTGHPLDGLLERYGWYGKAFITSGDVYPLLFRRGGELVAIEPAVLPVGVAMNFPQWVKSGIAHRAFSLAMPLLGTDKSSGRLRLVTFRGTVSAAIIYDRQPIIDHLRRLDENRVMGLMEWRSRPEPFFFLLTRVGESLPVFAGRPPVFVRPGG